MSVTSVFILCINLRRANSSSLITHLFLYAIQGWFTDPCDPPRYKTNPGVEFHKIDFVWDVQF